MNIIEKFILKQKDPIAYRNWKYLKRLKASQHLLQPISTNLEHIFKHSGNAGDIIYTLPCMYAIAKQNNFKIALSLEGKTNYDGNPHPLGDKMLTPKMVEMIAPLLLKQQQIIACYTLQQNEYTVDLDIFRRLPLLLDRGNLARWHFWCWGVNYDLNNAWLQAEPDENFKNSIVIARSQRYNQPGIDYSFLNKYPSLYFVGVQAEFDIMKKVLPQLQFAPVNDFYQLACIIAGAKLFIGNQSFPFSIAEGLKVNRLLEVYHGCPNVNVYGKNGYDFYFQPQFEKLVTERFENF